MSDAFTDIGRDSRRARNYSNYLEVLLGYLTDENTRGDLTVAAQRVDEVPAGYWNDRTNLMAYENFNLIEKLKSGDAVCWMLFLKTLQGETQQAFQDISPFKGKILLFLRQDSTAPQFKVDSASLHALLLTHVSEEKRHCGWMEFALTIDPSNLADGDIISLTTE